MIKFLKQVSICMIGVSLIATSASAHPIKKADETPPEGEVEFTTIEPLMDCKTHTAIRQKVNQTPAILHAGGQQFGSVKPRNATLLVCARRASSQHGVNGDNLAIAVPGDTHGLKPGRCGLFSGTKITAQSGVLGGIVEFCFIPNAEHE